MPSIRILILNYLDLTLTSIISEFCGILNITQETSLIKPSRDYYGAVLWNCRLTQCW